MIRSIRSVYGRCVADLDDPLGRLGAWWSKGQEGRPDSARAASQAALQQLFVEGGTVEAGELDEIEAGLGASLHDEGVLEHVPAGVRATVRISRWQGLLIAHDPPPGDRIPSDIILRPSPTTRTVAALTVRRSCRRALDVGTGCGALALLAAAHVDEVVATDVNARALWFTDLNARLNGIENVRCIEGDLFEPVSGELFDLVMGNLPFVLSPHTEYLFRDGKRAEGGDISERAIAAAADVLARDGFATFLVNWLVTDLDRRDAVPLSWAGVHEIEVDEIPDYVALLTPLVLTADTRVTNHGFIDGVAVPRQSVLQVGTAVLVDEFGAPRVRCSSGSPLLAPEAVQGTTSYTGQAWDTFTPTQIVAVAAAPDPLTEFVVFDVVAGDEFVRPVGSTGAADRAVLPGEVLAVGGFTSFSGYSGQIDANEFRMIFRTEGGPVEGSFSYALSIEGFTINGSGDLTGTFDPASATMSGTGFAQVSGGGVVSGGGSGAWSATVNPAAGTVSGSAGDADGMVAFELTFPPYSP